MGSSLSEDPAASRVSTMDERFPSFSARYVSTHSEHQANRRLSPEGGKPSYLRHERGGRERTARLTPPPANVPPFTVGVPRAAQSRRALSTRRAQRETPRDLASPRDGSDDQRGARADRGA